MRHLTSLLAGAAAAAFGALVLGEYDLTTSIALLAGSLFGLLVAEVVATVARRGSAVRWVPLGVVTGVVSAAGMAWAVWISTNRGRNPWSAAAWAGIVLAGAVAGGWVVSSAGRRRGGSPPPA